MGGMLETLRNAWKIPDLRKKILFTIAMLLVFRVGTIIPVPGIEVEYLKSAIGNNALFGFWDIISGGAFMNATIFAMSITPYITASIIMQLLTIAIPKLEQLQREGEEGRKIIAQYTRYGTVALGFIQAAFLYISLTRMVDEKTGLGALVNDNWLSFITITLTFTAGTAFLMWLGEQITEYGIGNGISLLIFAGIVSRAPQGVGLLINYAQKPGNLLIGIVTIIGILIVALAVIAAVIWVQQAERRIPVQYAKRVVGRKVYGGQSTHIPIKVNLAGVIPIIFAMSFIATPPILVGLLAPNTENWFLKGILDLQRGSWLGAVLNALLIIFFTFFYTIIQFNPIEIANNMKKNGGFIPGIRPGKPTSDYLSKVLNRITWFGGFFLAAVTVFPYILGPVTGISGVWFGGTAVLILVNVALDTIKQIESQMLMRHYKGFLE